jgi:hypothetical protein
MITPKNLVLCTLLISEPFMLIFMSPVCLLENIIKFVLETFRDNLLTLNHVSNFASSMLTEWLSVHKSEPDWKMFVSSANKMKFDLVDALQMSLINKVNKV